MGANFKAAVKNNCLGYEYRNFTNVGEIETTVSTRETTHAHTYAAASRAVFSLQWLVCTLCGTMRRVQLVQLLLPPPQQQRQKIRYGFLNFVGPVYTSLQPMVVFLSVQFQSVISCTVITVLYNGVTDR
jgi:hypothetical protein